MIAPQWQVLMEERKGNSEGLFDTLSSGRHSSQGEILFALGKNAELTLLMPVTGVPVKTQSFSEAIDVDFLEMTHDADRPKKYLVIQCVFRELNSYFSQFAEALLENVSSKRDSYDIFIETYERFRHLLSTRRLGAPLEKIVGLVGELVVLNEISGKKTSLMDYWYGPDREYHDVELPEMGIEVKTSRRSADTRVKISSLSQLTAAAGRPLYLWHVNLQRSPEGELDVYRLCLKLLRSGVDESRLMEKLSELDCYDFSADEWNYVSFSLCAQSVYRVDESFPKITAESILNDSTATAVTDVTYMLDLSYLNEWQVDAKNLINSLAGS